MRDEPRWHERMLLRLCPTLRGIVEEAQVERAEAVNQVLDQYRTITDCRAMLRATTLALSVALRVHGAKAARAAITLSDQPESVKQDALLAIDLCPQGESP